jgi:hypothetical protein
LKKFNQRKTIKRNSFTAVFGGFGKRRRIYYVRKTIPYGLRKRTKMQMIRRAHQGFRNQIFGRVNAIKMRLAFGRKNKVSQFRR